MNKLYEWWDKFTDIVLFTLPWGNDGRGTPVKLFAVAVPLLLVLGLVVYDHYYG